MKLEQMLALISVITFFDFNCFDQLKNNVFFVNKKKQEFGILTLCDSLRDNVLPELGVLIEDLCKNFIIFLGETFNFINFDP